MQNLMREMENWRQSMIKAAGYYDGGRVMPEGYGQEFADEVVDTDLSVPEDDTYDTNLTVPSYVPDTGPLPPPPDFETTPYVSPAPTPAGTSGLVFTGNPADTAQITNPAFGPNLPSDTTGPMPVLKAPASGGQFTQYGDVTQYDSNGNMLGYKNSANGEMRSPDPGDTTLSHAPKRSTTVTPAPKKPSGASPKTVEHPRGGSGSKRSKPHSDAEYQKGSDVL